MGVRSKHERITFKERKFVNTLIRSGRKDLAVTEAYEISDPKRINRTASSILARPQVQKYIAEVLDRAGMTPEALAGDLRKLLTSALTARSLRKTVPADALRAIEMGFKLHDAFPADRKTLDVRSINLNLDGKNDDEINETIKQLSEEVKKLAEAVG